MDLVSFINDGFTSQQKYATASGVKGPFDYMSREERHAKVIECIGHMIEETIEARVYVPRRSWKTAEPSFLDNAKLREEFIAEMFDVLLFFRATLAYAGVDGSDFVATASRKLNYNAKRKDHKVNGDKAAPADPSKELQGDCNSAKFDNDEAN